MTGVCSRVDRSISDLLVSLQLLMKLRCQSNLRTECHADTAEADSLSFCRLRNSCRGPQAW